MPLAGARNRGGGSGPVPGEGEVGERLEEIESYSEVVFSRSGAAGRWVGGGAELGAAVADGGGGAPTAMGCDGRAWGPVPGGGSGRGRAEDGAPLRGRHGGGNGGHRWWRSCSGEGSGESG